jgi:hypothetical protein
LAVAAFKTAGRHAELLCFWRCHVQTLRKSHRVTAFWHCQVQTLKNLHRNFGNLAGVAGFSFLTVSQLLSTCQRNLQAKVWGAYVLDLLV